MADPHAKDKELVARCLAGDQGAWEEFVGQYVPFLRNCLSSIASRRRFPLSEADVDDLVSRIWEDLLHEDKRLLRKYSAQAPLDRWLLAVAVNRLHPMVRSRVREHLRMDAFQNLQLLKDISPDLPEGTLERKETREQIQEAFQKLPVRERFAAAMFYQSDWTHREIAQALRIPLNHVGLLLQGARARLRALLRSAQGFLL